MNNYLVVLRGHLYDVREKGIWGSKNGSDVEVCLGASNTVIRELALEDPVVNFLRIPEEMFNNLLENVFEVYFMPLGITKYIDI